MDTYDGTTDPDEHIENIEPVLHYRNVRGAVKCKLFVTTLRRGAMNWYKNLRRNSIGSWDELVHEFTAHFTASRTHPKTVASLEAIAQRRTEALRSYIERFNKEAVLVRGADDRMKLYLIQKGLHPDSDLKKAVQLDPPRNLTSFLQIAKTYISYEEQQYADRLNRDRKEGSSAEKPKKPFAEKRKEGKPAREARGPGGRFTEYTPLAVSREKILSEISSADMKEAGIKFPKASAGKPGADKSKYCRYHKCYGHNTEDCIHLKDAIEILIQRGRLRQFTTNSSPERRSMERASDDTGKAVAMTVEQLGKFPEHVDATPTLVHGSSSPPLGSFMEEPRASPSIQ